MMERRVIEVEAKASLSMYSFNEMWHPGMIVILVAISLLYFLLVGPWRGRFQDSSPVSASHKFYFIIALVLYYGAYGSPWNVFGDYLFSVHMISMSVAYLCVPPLILLGIPSWFWKPILSMPKTKKLVQFFTNPIFAIVLFNMSFSIVHIPLIFNAVMGTTGTMLLVHYYLLLTGFLMWWPMISTFPELNKLTELKKFIYMCADGMLITPACALLFLSGHLVFEPYFNVPQIASFLSPLDDQQSAGVFMKAIQEITYGTAIGIVVYQWATKERSNEKHEDVYATSAMAQTLRPFNTQEGEQ